MKLVKTDQSVVEDAAVLRGEPALLFHSLTAHHGTGVQTFRRMWRHDFVLTPGVGHGTVEGSDAAFGLDRFLFLKLVRPYGGWDSEDDVEEPVVAFDFGDLLATGRLYMHPTDIGLSGAVRADAPPRAFAEAFEAYTQRDPRAVRQLAAAHIKAASRRNKYDDSHLATARLLYPANNLRDAATREAVRADWDEAMFAGPLWTRTAGAGAQIEMIYEGGIPIRTARFYRAPGHIWYRVVP